MTADVCPECGSRYPLIRDDVTSILMNKKIKCRNKWHDQPAPIKDPYAEIGRELTRHLREGATISALNPADCLNIKDDGTVDAGLMIEHKEPAPQQPSSEAVKSSGQSLQTTPPREAVAESGPADPVSATPRTHLAASKVTFQNMHGPLGKESWAKRDDVMELLSDMSEVERELAEAKRKLSELEHNLYHWGTIEIAVRNPAVAESMRHWEGRAASAETARAHNAAIDAGIDHIKDVCGTDAFYSNGTPTFEDAINALTSLKVPQ